MRDLNESKLADRRFEEQASQEAGARFADEWIDTLRAQGRGTEIACGCGDNGYAPYSNVPPYGVPDYQYSRPAYSQPQRGQMIYGDAVRMPSQYSSPSSSSYESSYRPYTPSYIPMQYGRDTVLLPIGGWH